MNTTKLITGVQKKALGYMGYVSCYLNGSRLWTEYTGIHRLNTTYALQDAENLLQQIDQQNHIRKEATK